MIEKKAERPLGFEEAVAKRVAELKEEIKGSEVDQILRGPILELLEPQLEELPRVKRAFTQCAIKQVMEEDTFKDKTRRASGEWPSILPNFMRNHPHRLWAITGPIEHYESRTEGALGGFLRFYDHLKGAPFDPEKSDVRATVDPEIKTAYLRYIEAMNLQRQAREMVKQQKGIPADILTQSIDLACQARALSEILTREQVPGIEAELNRRSAEDKFGSEIEHIQLKVKALGGSANEAVVPFVENRTALLRARKEIER